MFSEKTRIVGAGAIGNVLEWYDFAIYGYFAIIIGQTFFPHQSELAQLLSAFGVFAIGCLMRPLGSLVSGSIGDRFGRRAALNLSMAAMAFSTFLVGILPGYESLGLLAPVLLTALRIVQGLSIGGECPTAFIFMIEHAGPRRRGLAGAMATGGGTAGILFGSATGALLTAVLPPEALQDWGWRLPFLLGLPIGLLGIWLRRRVPEPPRTSGMAETPVREVLHQHLWLLARLAGIAALGAVTFYIVFLYLVSWLQFVDGVAPVRALAFNTVAMAVALPIYLGAGWLSDRIGRRRLLLIAMAAAMVGAVPLFWLLHHPDPLLVMAGQLGFVAIIGTVFGVEPAFMVEATPARIRCTAVALGFNLPAGVLGGLSPLAAAWLIHRTGNDLSPAFLIVGAAAISFAATASFPDRTGLPDDASAAPPKK
ncbi:MFS transporter [uncultured Reyranella sp.]|jgi:MHS family proline/betaine transporter-like MFS transporter|uniref:MFS transporter n=1 Tax=uncultured Reyranella sp. TaxID=735512 RepID=UPI00259CE570|nr:MFS transporter [uncultured Reyranella sp.]